RDNWALGWSDRYTVGVWVGNASGAPMWDVSGTSGAAPVWARLMRALHANAPSRAPHPPPGLTHTTVHFGNRLEAAREEWFLPGTAQTLFAVETDANPGNTEAAIAARITAPQDGVILALDPDIPPTRQRLTLLAEPGSAAAANLRWRIDGRDIGRGLHAQWLPWPGRHVVQLHDAQGRVLDARRVEVRGAVVKKTGA
ncbi:MAG: penicillin-binding protein 1C, partial [Burkholderiaceae bacterium]|nr:penicillin-binding protein 1C [Burkholderiaceae bacterium]